MMVVGETIHRGVLHIKTCLKLTNEKHKICLKQIKKDGVLNSL